MDRVDVRMMGFFGFAKLPCMFCEGYGQLVVGDCKCDSGEVRVEVDDVMVLVPSIKKKIIEKQQGCELTAGCHHNFLVVSRRTDKRNQPLSSFMR